MGYNELLLSLYSNLFTHVYQLTGVSGINLSHNSKMVGTCFDWRCIAIISTPPTTSPTLPLSYGFHYSGMRVRGLEKPALHTCSAEWRHPSLKLFTMAKTRERGEHSRPISTLTTVLTGGNVQTLCTHELKLKRGKCGIKVDAWQRNACKCLLV